MARVSIYVPDDLKARMDAAGDSVNWSSIAQTTFQEAVVNFEHRTGNTMDTAIERLRASKEKYVADMGINAENRGREWAANTASFEDLQRIAAIEEFFLDPIYASQAAKMVFDAVNEDGEVDRDDVLSHFKVDAREAKDLFMQSFARGARAFFLEVEGKL